MGQMEGLNLLLRYEVSGKRYYVVRSWGEHQRPDKPKKSKLPPPPRTVSTAKREASTTRPRHLPAPSPWEGKGKEGRGGEQEGRGGDPTGLHPRVPASDAAPAGPGG